MVTFAHLPIWRHAGLNLRGTEHSYEWSWRIGIEHGGDVKATAYVTMTGISKPNKSHAL